MNSYGEEAAQRLMQDHAEVTMAALDGNLEALSALLSLGCQSSYTDGMSTTAQTYGFPL